MSGAGDRERLALLVHEVRSPVAALSAIAETFRDPDLGPDVRRELASLAAAACRGIERIVTDAALGSVRRERLDLRQLVREACAAAALGGARVRAVLPAAAVPADADPLRLRQALDNLVANAVVHGRGADVVVTLRGDGEPRIEVADRGPGIAPADRERIFEAGVRLDGAAPGSGLGLAVARAIAAAHGGRLTVDSTPGRGATFTLALPAPGSRSFPPEASP
jgi:two-component system OmpR family sensor kinase